MTLADANRARHLYRRQWRARLHAELRADDALVAMYGARPFLVAKLAGLR